MKITVGSRITVCEPSIALIEWVNRELRIPNPDYALRLRRGMYLGSTPKTLDLFEWHGDDLLLPFGTLFDIKGCLNTRVTSEFKSRTTVDFGGKDVPLYDYQRKAVEEAYLAHFGIIQAPAGSGKTQMGIALAKKIGRRTLWITHTADLLKQSRDRAAMYCDTSGFGTITEGKVQIGKTITFATIQTLCKLDLLGLRDEWDVIICDECHRISGTPTNVTQYYKVLNNLAASYKYGLSATVHRSDGMIRATFALLGHVCTTVSDADVADKIMQVTVTAVETPTQMSRNCLGTDGMLNYGKLINHLADDEQRSAVIITMLERNADHSCLVLSDRVEHLENLMLMLPAYMREDACMVTGTMTTKRGKADRQKYIEMMRSGEKKYLFATYALAKEGLDIPRLDRLFLATPHKDFAVVTQSIGRIARIHEGKGEPVVYDFVDSRIPYLWKCYKARVAIYKKNHCKL